jgi:hypothetical protein
VGSSHEDSLRFDCMLTYPPGNLWNETGTAFTCRRLMRSRRIKKSAVRSPVLSQGQILQDSVQHPSNCEIKIDDCDRRFYRPNLPANTNDFNSYARKKDCSNLAHRASSTSSS